MFHTKENKNDQQHVLTTGTTILKSKSKRETSFHTLK